MLEALLARERMRVRMVRVVPLVLAKVICRRRAGVVPARRGDEDRGVEQVDGERRDCRAR